MFWVWEAPGTHSAHALASSGRNSTANHSSAAARVRAWARALVSRLAAQAKLAGWGEDRSLPWAPGRQERSGVTCGCEVTGGRALREGAVQCRTRAARGESRAWGPPAWLGPYMPADLPGAAPRWSPLCCLTRQLPERVRRGTAEFRWVLQRCLYHEGSGLAADCRAEPGIGEQKEGRAGGPADSSDSLRFKGPWASRGIPVKGIHGLQRPPRPVTIGLQDCSQHWVGTTQSVEWHSSDSWPWWSGGTGTSGPKCCVWHHRPQYPARPHAASARNKWCCARMVWVVPDRAHSEDSNWWCLVTGQVPPLLCPPGLGPGSASLPHLHSPTPSPDTISWAAGAWICRWYLGLVVHIRSSKPGYHTTGVHQAWELLDWHTPVDVSQ